MLLRCLFSSIAFMCSSRRKSLSKPAAFSSFALFSSTSILSSRGSSRCGVARGSTPLLMFASRKAFSENSNLR